MTCSLSYECKYAQNAVSKNGCNWCLDLWLANHISCMTLTKRTDISNSRAFIQLVKCHYMTFSFWLVLVIIMHKMVCRKAPVTHIWGHNTSIIAHKQVYPRKRKYLIVMRLFRVWMVHIRHILFDLCMIKRGKKERKKKGKNKKNKKEEQNRNFCIQFSWLWEVMGLWGYILHKNS